MSEADVITEAFDWLVARIDHLDSGSTMHVPSDQRLARGRGLSALARLEAERDDLHAVWKATERQLAEAEERSRLLAEALSHYANEDHWTIDLGADALDADGWNYDGAEEFPWTIARAALAAQAVDRTLEGER